MKDNINFTLLLLIIQGYICGTYASLFPSGGSVSVSSMIMVILYYIMLTLVFGKFRFFFTIIVTLSFFSLVMVFRFSHSLSFNAIWLSINSHSLPIILYAYVFLPVLFFATSADFYAIVYQVPLYFGRAILIPVLIKRELIRLRYLSIVDNLLSRGVSISSLKGFWTLHLWLLPLLMTTIMEGTETYEYNSMLQTKIQTFRRKKPELTITRGQKILAVLVLTTVLIRIVLWINT